MATSSPPVVPPAHHVFSADRRVFLGLLIAILVLAAALLAYYLVASDGTETAKSPASVADVATSGGNWSYSQAREHVALVPATAGGNWSYSQAREHMAQ